MINHIDDYELAQGCWNIVVMIATSTIPLLTDHVDSHEILDFLETKYPGYPLCFLSTVIVSDDIAERQKDAFINKDYYIGADR